MTAPIRVVPGQTYLITRRCTERRYLLRPDRPVTKTLEHLLAVAQERFGIDLHAACGMSNHYHLVATDTRGCMPDFLQWLNGMSARSINVYRGRSENFWSSDRTNRVMVVDREAALDAIVYVMSNPVAAGCVSHGRDWPGLRSNPQDYLAPGKATRRPKFFFRSDGDVPLTATLHYTIPKGFAHMEPKQFAALVSDRVASAEAGHRQKAREQGLSFSGSRAIRKVRWTSAPTTRESRTLNPTVKASTQAGRAYALSLLATFRAQYKRALVSFNAGVRNVVFPAGTWQLVRRHHVRCHSPPC